MQEFINMCGEFGHRWDARYVAKLIQNGKIVGTIARDVDGFTVTSFPYSQKTGLTLVRLYDIMRDVRDGKPLSEIMTGN